MLLLFGKSLLKLKELLLLALANGVVLGGALAALEGVTMKPIMSEYPKPRLTQGRQRPFPRIESFCLPLAAGTARSTSVTLGHGAGSGGKGGGADGTESSRLGEGCTKHRR